MTRSNWLTVRMGEAGMDGLIALQDAEERRIGYRLSRAAIVKRLIREELARIGQTIVVSLPPPPAIEDAPPRVALDGYQEDDDT